MYLQVKKYATSKGFTVEPKHGIAYGQMNGYLIAILQDSTTTVCHTINIWVKEGGSEPIPGIGEFINQCKDKFRFLKSISYSEGKVTANFLGTGLKWVKEYIPTLDSFLVEITGYLQMYNFNQCCEVCNETDNYSLYQINDTPHLLCHSCHTSLLEEKQSLIEERKKSGCGNIIGGIIGALFGSLLGVALWVIIYQLGYIAAISGVLIVIGAMKGYELLGGRLNIIGILISCALSLIMVLFAEQLVLSIEIYKAFKDYEITFFEAFRSVPSFLEDSEVRNAARAELLVGYFLTAIGAFSTIRQALKNNSRVVDIKMISSVK